MNSKPVRVHWNLKSVSSPALQWKLYHLTVMTHFHSSWCQEENMRTQMSIPAITTRRLKRMFLASWRLSFTVNLTWHEIVSISFFSCLCHLFFSFSLSIYTALIWDACGVLVWFLSAEVKKHDMPLGHNYPMPATITVVPLQSFPGGRGCRAHTASPYPPWVMDLWYPPSPYGAIGHIYINNSNTPCEHFTSLQPYAHNSLWLIQTNLW